MRRIEALPEGAVRSGVVTAIRAWWSALGNGMRIGTLVASAFVVAIFTLPAVQRAPDVPLRGTGATDSESAALAPTPSPKQTPPPVPKSAAGRVAETKYMAPPPVALEINPPRRSLAEKSAAVPAAAPAAGTQRSIARTATLGLVVSDVGAAVEWIDALARRAGGLVTTLTDDVPSADGVRHTATLELGIPADRLSATTAAIATLGAVRSRRLASENLTEQIVDTDARLRNLRSEERDLLTIVDRSGKIADVLEVESHLASVRETIETLAAEAKTMRRRVAFASLTVESSDERTAAAVVPQPAAQLADAWRSAREAVWTFTLALIARALWVVAFLPYACALAIVVLLLRRRYRSRL